LGQARAKIRQIEKKGRDNACAKMRHIIVVVTTSKLARANKTAPELGAVFVLSAGGAGELPDA
jgi:hypothetical protein